jgi:hypothetical protein
MEKMFNYNNGELKNMYFFYYYLEIIMINFVYDLIRLPITITTKIGLFTYEILETPYRIYKNKGVCSPEEEKIPCDVATNTTSIY